MATGRQPTETAGSWQSLKLQAAATLTGDAVLEDLESTRDGLSSNEAARRLADVGLNALRSHGARALLVLARQFHNPLLILLLATALVSPFVGEGTTRSSS